MKALIKELRTAVLATAALAAIVCCLYPLTVWGVAQLLFPHQASGALIIREGRVIGSKLIGQNFTGPGYFHSRPSAAGAGYDAAASGGSNLGPLSKKLIDAVESRAAAYRLENGLPLMPWCLRMRSPPPQAGLIPI